MLDGLTSSMEQTKKATTAETQETTTPSWYFSEPKDDFQGVAGNGDVPEWFIADKYKSVEQQAKAYKDASKLLGGFTGAPEKYELPSEIASKAENSELLGILDEVGRTYNMNNEAYTDLVNKYIGFQEKQQQVFQQEQLKQLGENGEARISHIKDWVNANVPQDLVPKLVNVATTADAIEMIEFFMNKSKGTKPANEVSLNTPAMSESEYAEALLKKDAHGNLLAATDKDYKKKIDELTRRRMG